MPRGFHSSAILVIVFVLGLAAGIAGMIWAWPGVHARYFSAKRQPFIQRMQSSLQLTPQQVAEVKGVFKDAGTVRHDIHLQFEPQYHALCEQYVTMSEQERSTYLQSPQRKQLLDKLHSIMTANQWQGWEKLTNSGGHHAHHDPCEHSHANGNKPAASSGSGH